MHMCMEGVCQDLCCMTVAHAGSGLCWSDHRVCVRGMLSHQLYAGSQVVLCCAEASQVPRCALNCRLAVFPCSICVCLFRSLPASGLLVTAETGLLCMTELVLFCRALFSASA